MTIFVERLGVPKDCSRIERRLSYKHLSDGLKLSSHVLHRRHALSDDACRPFVRKGRAQNERGSQ